MIWFNLQWLVLGLVGLCLPHAQAQAQGSVVINDRTRYHAHARDAGMCHKRSNPSRVLVVPGPDVVSKFSVCQGRNEFGELVADTSGSVYCNGTLIHLWNDARDHYGDSKTFVDRASNLSGIQISSDLQKLLQSRNFTASNFIREMETRFQFNEPGRELEDYDNSRFPHTPAVIHQIRPQARVFRAWTKIVHHYWNTLDRTMIQKCISDNKGIAEAQLLPGPGSPPASAANDAMIYGYSASREENCTTSIIRLEHPFIIAGGRFREQYYWDSFFVMEGLLAANMTYLARTTLLNFMDEIRSYGFIPNGGRKYYLNRSQPPLFVHMLHAYVHSTNDTAILHGALPLAERELRWWAEKRSVLVRSPNDPTQTHFVYHYNVQANGPRPESYAEDWMTAWCDETPPTREDESKIYSELASGAESGWDYTARWMGDPSTLSEDRIEQMRRVQIRRLIPVDLNSILFRCHTLMADLYQLSVDDESPYAWQHKRRHEKAASNLKAAVLDLHWCEAKSGFYDFELDDPKDSNAPRTGKTRSFWSGAALAPFWSDIWPDSVRSNQQKAMEAFSGMRDLLKRYQGPLPATVTNSGQQWDFPNAWPPLQYIALKALQNLPYNLTTMDAFEFAKVQTPDDQLGVQYEDLPVMEGRDIQGKDLDGTTSSSWRNVMLKELAMRYMTSAFCNWNITGKLRDDDIEEIVQDDPEKDVWLNRFPGAMYEKLNAWDITRSGHGGEYEIQTGFGWTNGVAIWIAHVLGMKLDNPACPAPASYEHVATQPADSDPPPRNEMVAQLQR
ncbi:glycoside hydrolase [Ceratobasidium sp. AG-I]|nr:glycoside hydrolase [Ceratobasidium sp. AG-I]